MFDAPFLDGKDMRSLPLVERKARLKKIFESGNSVRFSDDLTGTASEVLEHACKLKLEGLIGKQAESVYVAGRSKSWIKLKCRQQQDFVIVGYTAPKGSRHGFGALAPRGVRKTAQAGLRRQGRHRLRRRAAFELSARNFLL